MFRALCQQPFSGLQHSGKLFLREPAVRHQLIDSSFCIEVAVRRKFCKTKGIHFPTAFTTFCAASAIESPVMMATPDSAKVFLPARTLLPSSRTTSGIFKCVS